MSLSFMANRILRFCPGLNLDLIKSCLQDSYQQLCLKDWNRLNLQRQIHTFAQYSTGTVAVTADGTVTGTGTGFNDQMVGYFMKCYYDSGFFEIESYASPTSIKLKDWPGGVVSAQTYSIFKTVHTLDPSLKQVFDVVYQIPLHKRSQAYFNKIDPYRSTTSSTPTAWALAGIAASGAIQIEIFPVPTQVVPLRIYGRMGSTVLADDESPRLPEDLLEAHALIDCYRIKDLKDPGQGWDAKIGTQMQFFQDILADYEEEDFQLGDHNEKVKDMMGETGFPQDDNFGLSHDVD